MKVKEGYILREVAGNYLVVAVGDASLDFNGVITLNETGAFLWNKLTEDADELVLISAMTEEYDIDADTAKADVLAFIGKLKEAELLA